MSSGTDGQPIAVVVVTADTEFAAACDQQLPQRADIQVTTATTVGEAVDRLAGPESIDCIVSDHDLPDTDGVAFLEIVRAQAPTLPFILFTSEGSEDVASRAISADVTEYLIKEHHADQWDRLAGLIEDTVAYYRTHGSLVDTESRAKTLLDAAQDMIAVTRGDQFEYINQTGLDLLRGDSRSAVIGRPVGQILSTVGETSIADRLTAVQTGERSLTRTEAWLTADDGRTLPVELTATHVEWMDEPAVALVGREISERKEYESDLELKNRAIDEAPIGITIADASKPDNPLIYVNDEFERLTGYRGDEVLDRNCRFLQGEDTREEPVAEMREAIAADEPVTVEVRNYRKDGTEFWNRVTIAPVENGIGEVTHYVGFQEDVTERKESEQTLQQFRRAVEAAGYAIYITDSDGTIQYANPAFEEITGYSSDEAVGMTPQILKSGEMSEEYYTNLWATITDGSVWEEEIQDRRKSGELYYAQQTIAPVIGEDGAVSAFVAIQTDITDQKERENHLRQYERAIDGANELIAAIDEDYRYLFANPAYCEFHDLDPGQLTDTALQDALSHAEWEIVEPYVEQTLAGTSVQYRMRRSRPNRPDKTFDIRYHPLEDETGEIRGAVATMRDLTAQIEREQQLAALDRMLRHTLRNELNAILSRAELIAAEASGDGAGDVASNADTIIQIVNRVLDQAAKEREIVELLTNISDPSVYDLSDLIETVVTRVEATFPEAEITLDVPEEVEVTTIPEVKRAIEEVIENAVSHTDQEVSDITVRITEHEETIELSVADTGPGIPPMVQKLLTDEAEIEPLLHSSGMGLWLVKRILNRIGGTVHFEEATPRGSVVTLVIPRDGPIPADGAS
jgi:PAS domain S-box-containing protein